MSATDEKTTFGATVVKPSPPSQLSANRPTLHVKPSMESAITVEDSPASRSPSPALPKDPSNPFSAFYSHPTTRNSLEQQNSKTNLDVYVRDIEKQAASGLSPLASSMSNLPKHSTDGRVKECTVWPSKNTLKSKARQQKCKNSKNPWKRMSKKQKIASQVLVFLLVVGLGVGLGVGISRAVGGSVTNGSGQNRPVDPNKGGS